MYSVESNDDVDHRQVVDVMQRDSIKTRKLALQRHITIIDILAFS